MFTTKTIIPRGVQCALLRRLGTVQWQEGTRVPVLVVSGAARAEQAEFPQ